MIKELSQFNVHSLIDTWRFNRDFRKAHPYAFNEYGISMFCGSQGSGKTYSLVKYVLECMERYPLLILVSNCSIVQYPFNFTLRLRDGLVYAYDLVDNKEVLMSDIEQHLRNIYPRRACFLYEGLDTLKYIENGYNGVLYAVDELHLEFNSLESKNISIEEMIEFSQQRKQRKAIVGTSQQFLRLAKPLREQVSDIILCSRMLGLMQYNLHVDGQSITEDNGQIIGKIRKRAFFFHRSKIYKSYDTYAKMGRYKNEWNGHARSDSSNYNTSYNGKGIKRNEDKKYVYVKQV